MKQIYFLTTILFLTFINSNAQITFEWGTATDNGDNLTETINGITLTTSCPDIKIGARYLGDYIAEATTLDVVTFTFSEPVDVSSILALELSFVPYDYTFTPVDGSNSPVTVNIDGAAQVNLNWTDITSFTVSGPPGELMLFGFDNLVVNTPPLSTNDYTFKSLDFFPNPSSDFIKINGLTTIESYRIYNTLGKEVKKGIVVENEKIDIQNLKNGLYFLKFKQGNTVKFMKE